MRVFRDAKYVSSSVFVGVLLASFRSILVLRLLGPVLTGAWKTALLVDTLGEFARAGVLRGMSIRVPMLRGQGNEEEADRNAAVAGGFLFWLGVAVAVVILGTSFLAHDANVRLSLRFLAIVVGVTQPYYFLRELAAVRHESLIRSKEMLLRSVVDLVAAAALCRLLGLAGLGIATSLALIVTAVFLLRSQTIPFQLRISRKEIADLMRVGVPFSLTEAGYELLRRVDVFVIALFLGPTAVGFYGISILVMDFAVVLGQKGVSQVLSPHLMKEFGRTGSFSDVAIFYELPARLFCYLLPPLLGAGTFLIGAFTRTLLPQYSAGIGAAEVTLWSIYFVALHFSINSFFVASNMLPRITRLLSGAIVMAALAQATVLLLGFGIAGAAWCTLATSAIWAAVELFVARASCGHAIAGTLRFITSLYIPFAACLALRALVQAIPLETWLPGLEGSLLEPVARMTLFLLCYTPVFMTYEIKFSMLRLVRQAS